MLTLTFSGGTPAILARVVAHAAWPLRADPDLDALRGHRGDGVQRLHLGVGDVIRAVFARDDLSGGLERILDLARLAADDRLASGIGSGSLEGLQPFARIVARARSLGPFDLQRGAGCQSLLDPGGDDGDALRHRDHMAHARHLPQLVAIVRLRRRAHYGRPGHHAVDHAAQAHIDGVILPAGRLGRHVPARDILADEPEAGDRLEVRRFDLGELVRGNREGRDLAVAHLPVRGRMDHHRGLGRQLGRRHLPALGRCVEEDAAGLRAGRANGHPVGAGRQARDHELRAEDRVIIGGCDRRGADAHAAPVGVQLLGQDQRQGGVGGLAHLGGGRHDGDRAVGRDRDIGVEAPGGGRRGLGLRRLGLAVWRQREGQREACAARENRATRGAGRGGRDRAFHRQAPLLARSTAATICG